MVLSLLVSVSDAARIQVRSIATTVLDMEDVSDWALNTVLLCFGYTANYLSTAAIFEFTNPVEKTPKRIANIKAQIKYGAMALLCITVYATLWLWRVDPHLPFDGYWETRRYTMGWFVINLAVYMLWMDSFFYWSHRLMHITWPVNLWWHIHRHHHQFVEPSAFAQDAVHPLEALLQGPFPHFLTFTFHPLHPVSASVFGFLTSVFAIAAHDGRSLDLNDHCKHHHFKHCNYGLYWGLWDYLMGTRFSSKFYPIRASPTDVELVDQKYTEIHGLPKIVKSQ